MKSVVVLQARTNSSRLPGKVLLPVNEIPLVVLAAKRAANTGKNVIVATSEESTDDALVQTLKKFGVDYFRGSLNNTLERIVLSLEGYDDETLVFRLTADNVFPDGLLLDEMEESFAKNTLEYLCCNGERSGLPYGMSAELTRLRHLREAADTTQCQYEQEHVTPYIRRKFGDAYFDKYKEMAKGHYRCTVDCLDDYLNIQRVFSDVENPVDVAAFSLVERLSKTIYQPLVSTVTSKLVLGTAQLGLLYGINNQSGKPDQALAEGLIKTAIVNGAQYIDTARAYGHSESTIGNAMQNGWHGRAQIITKLSPMTSCSADASFPMVSAFVDASIYQSCSSLRVQQLDVLMLHRASHISSWGGGVWNRLLEHKASGVVKALGVSVQSPEELDMVLDTSEISFVQMPFNLLDWRWEKVIPKIISEKKKRNLVIHIRSALLQGLLLSKSQHHWKKANVIDFMTVTSWLEAQTEACDKKNVVDFCLSYVKSIDWIDGLVIGVETLDQLLENIQILSGNDLSQQQVNTIQDCRPFLDEQTLNPANWR